MMPNLIDQQRPLENRLLAALPGEVYDQLVPSLELVSLTLKQILSQPNRALAYVYFPLTTVTSLITLMQEGQSVEVDTIGNEGMVGLPVFLGAETVIVRDCTSHDHKPYFSQTLVHKGRAVTISLSFSFSLYSWNFLET
jgi:hypothetical protein